jgi:hypothetical protein
VPHGSDSRRRDASGRGGWHAGHPGFPQAYRPIPRVVHSSAPSHVGGRPGRALADDGALDR